MPATVNGIGTMYYGKKNLRVHHGQCEFCNRFVDLKEYETVYWAVVAFIPVIPLGRKKILNECPTCTRHRVMPLAEWNGLREKSVQEKTEAFAKSQDDPQAALELLQTLSAFGQLEEADKLAQGMQDRFDDDSEVQVWTGEWHALRGRGDEAARCYRRAYQLKPDNLAAKRAVAACLMDEGQTEQALALIQSAPEITPKDDPALHVSLGEAFQRNHQHGDALAAFGRAVEAVPQLQADKQFRKLVRTSEKSDPAGTTILPRTPFYRTWRAVAGMAVLAIVALLLCANFYIATHRTVHLVNGFDVPVKLALDDRPAITIAPHSWQTSSIAEGRHRAVATAGGKPLSTEEFELATGFWHRWLDDPVFAVNAGGGAIIVWEQAIYAKRPIAGGSFRVEAGTPFVAFADVDFAFVPFPPSIKVEPDKPVTRTRVGLIAMPVDQIFYLNQDVAPDAQLAYAETHLTLDPENKAALQAYMRAAAEYGMLKRASEFLEMGLDTVPVRIEWHRMAQQFAQSEEQTERLRQRYRQWLEQNPKDSSVLYLMGRLEPNANAAVAFYDRAIAADPQNPYPWYAKGFHRCSAGEFSAARVAYEKAVALRPDDEDFQRGLRDARLALGQFSELEREARQHLVQDPHNFEWHMLLLEVLVAQGNLREAMDANAEYVNALNALPESGDNVQQAIELAEIMLWYLQHDFQQILEYSQRSPGEFAFLRYQSHLELDMYDEAAADLALTGTPPDPFDELRLSIAWRMSGNEAKADEWQDRACQQFEQGSEERRQIASMLRDPAKATLAAVQDLTLQGQEKAILSIALAQQSPENEAAFLKLAEKLNYSRTFSYYFNNRAIAAVRKRR